ncbi:MAG: RAMP superfamily CRISPR-associated protein [Anaerolineae bacterium]|nr:RAMP superfamily CRISPR-associated protein [Anaerolineae bacterium]
MQLQGKLIAETPIYRGNMRKTLFTRDGDGTQRLVSLAGEIAGTAQALMDAFIGKSRDGKNSGLLLQLWQRLYGEPMPPDLITRVECRLRQEAYPRDRFFDLRMGLRLDEDRWAIEANANYKMETLYRNAVFDFALTVNDAVMQKEPNAARLYFVLQELCEGRFWFGAGKSKGLGRVRLELQTPLPAPTTVPTLQPRANHLRLTLTFNARNPVLVGWNWGKVEPDVPAYKAVEGRLLVEAMRDLPEGIRHRLSLVLAGPILTPDDWKQRFAELLPRTIAVWLRDRSAAVLETWVLHTSALNKLSKGKHPLGQQVLQAAQRFCEKPFPSKDAARTALEDALGDKAHMAKRILEVLECQQTETYQLDAEAWRELNEAFGFDATLQEQVTAALQDEDALTQVFARAVKPLLPRLYLQVDQQITLVQSDAWVDAEIDTREQHLKIKTLLLQGKISEAQWDDRNSPPAGVPLAAWRSFLDEHPRARYQHLLNATNLRKSITNDQNFIAFLKSYRERVRVELAQPHLIDFRAGGPFNRDVSRKYGKPYDTVFMRMLTWSPSSQQEGAWEIYIPGSTIKGAFRKRASQVLKTLWGESPKTTQVLDYLFGTQGKRGTVFFSDAYLADPRTPERNWCSMDGVRMDPATARPIETAKRDYLFPYGDELVFRFQIDLLDVNEEHQDALAVLAHLLQDFQRGDIPIGGEKTSGFGWVKGQVAQVEWLTATPDGISAQLFGEQALTRQGAWYRLTLQGQDALTTLRWLKPLPSNPPAPAPPRAVAGFISHRAFGGYSGKLIVEAKVLSPLHIAERGEPSFRGGGHDGTVNGWDFFALAPAEAALRPDKKLYALPSRSIKGLLRHIYTIASNAATPSTDLSKLNPADALFGWVGQGPNQAIMGRLAFEFGLFEDAELAWFKVPYPYTGWTFEDGKWQHQPGHAVPIYRVGNWRLFRHAPLAPIVKRLDTFAPDTLQASYVRAILPGARARLAIRFWNLEKQELQRLIWCIVLEPHLAHKLGKHRHVGFGSVRLSLLPESWLTRLDARYAAADDARWQQPLVVSEWLEPKVIAYYSELKTALNAQSL